VNKKYYVHIYQEDSCSEFDNPPYHVCISPYEDDIADAICWMSDDLELSESERLANIMCEALNKS